jgi:hypothetical protein
LTHTWRRARERGRAKEVRNRHGKEVRKRGKEGRKERRRGKDGGKEKNLASHADRAGGGTVKQLHSPSTPLPPLAEVGLAGSRQAGRQARA